MTGLLLPTGLRRDRRQAEQHAERSAPPVILGNGCEVRRRAVWMNRHGWRHEVTALWTARDRAGEAVQIMDALWLDVEHQAEQLARAAADQLRAGELPAGGLSALARRLRLTFAAA